MDPTCRSEKHRTDPELTELLLARADDPHVAACAQCAGRAEELAAALDPTRHDDPFDEVFYQRQAARIRARLAPWPRWRWHGSPAWAAAACAVVVALAAVLAAPHLLAPPEEPPATAGVRFATAEDAVDDLLLRKIDALLAQDPYAVDLCLCDPEELAGEPGGGSGSGPGGPGGETPGLSRSLERS